MANYRPKSLNELNQVYGKAMKAEKAIKEGSLSLTKEDDKKDNPEVNIFDQLQQQAAKTPKNEIYDDEIANIANDFIKRFTESDKPKAQVAPKELRRPAPSIKSLYHTPVQPQQQDDDISQREAEFYRAPSKTPAVKPMAPHMMTPEVALKAKQDDAPSVAFAKADENEKTPVMQEPTNDVAFAPETAAPEVVVPVTQAPPMAVAPTPHREVSPTVHITSTERSSLMEEYQRVMSDEDDDDYYETKKTKKRSIFSRKKKIRSEDEAPYDSLDYTEDENSKEEIAEEMSVVPFDSSKVKLTDEPLEYPADEKVMNLYDYIDADFEGEGSSQDDGYDEIDELNGDSEQLPMTQQELDNARDEAENDESRSSHSEDVLFSADADFVGTVNESEKLEEAEETNDTAEEAEAVETVEAIEEAEEVVEAEEIEQVEAEEVVEAVEAEEVAQTTEAVIIPEEAEQDTFDAQTPDEQEDLPTAGMTFDDVFSVTDESKRSYSGGNWADVFANESHDENETQNSQDEQDSDYDDSDDSYEQDEDDTFEPSIEYMPTKAKKGKRAPKVLLGILIFVCTLALAAVVALGSFVAPDTGKLFLNKYRAFTCEQDYSFIGVSEGDLVITVDDGVYATEGDAFVYVNHDTQSFVMAKHSGSTSGLDGDVLFIAENEAGRVLVSREDTLGTITESYSDIGAILSPISDNYIIIAALLLLIILIAVLLMILPNGKKQGSKKIKSKSSSNSAKLTQYQSEDEDDYGDEDEDVDDDDLDGIEEGIFSEI